MSDTAIILVNLGTPDSPEPKAVKRYLAEFLSDRRVVEIPPIAWQPILRGVVLRTRPKKSAEAYRQVWTVEGSPLMALELRFAVAHLEAAGGSASQEAGRRGHRRARHALRQSFDRRRDFAADGAH